MSSSPNKRRYRKGQSGSVLIEFALVSLALYLIMAITVEFGRAFLMANITQNLATAAASLLVQKKIAKTATTSDELMTNADVLKDVFDPNLLVVDTGCAPRDGDCINTFIGTLPKVNQTLVRTMMLQDSNTTTAMFRYPGAIPWGKDAENPYGIVTVTHDAGGAETIACCAPILQGEILVDPDTSIRSIHVTINYPYQAVMLSDFGPPHPIDADGNQSNIYDADGNLGVHLVKAEDPDTFDAGPYTGEFGLGKQYAFSQAVRPYRRLISMESTWGVAP